MAVQDISIPLKYVYVQGTAPTDKTEGKLWYNTSDKALYTSDGTNYVVLDFDTSYIDQQQLEQNINILINSASASSTLNDYDEMFLDIFTSEGGELSTVDTDNTNSIFSTNEYTNDILGSEVTDVITSTSNSGGALTVKAGYKCTAKTDLKITEITKNNGGATKWYIYDTDTAGTLSGLLSSGTFSGSSGVLTNPLSIAKDSTFYIVVDNNGTSTDYRNDGGATPVTSGTNINFPYGYKEGVGEGNIGWGILNIKSKKEASSPFIVQTNAETITANPTHHQLYCHNTVAGTGSITYDISFDGGTTWDTDQSLNTKNTSGHPGSSMIIKLNLNGTGAGNTAKAKDYAVMLYY